MKKIIICSGGLDSVTLLHDITNLFGNKNVLALSFNYGSKHNAFELPMAVKNCSKLKVKHKIIDLISIFANFNSALLKDGEAIPEGYYADKNMKKTVIPFRNGILLSIAIAMAENIEADTVFYGAHSGDFNIYPDCRLNFIKSMKAAAIHGTYNRISILAPYSEYNKTSIIKRGLQLGVNYSLTHTCYNPDTSGHPCGKCGACVERCEAFVNNKLRDPIYSEGKWEEAVKYMKEVTK